LLFVWEPKSKRCQGYRVSPLLLGATTSSQCFSLGVGDLMLTCFGPLSRNRTVGVRLYPRVTHHKYMDILLPFNVYIRLGKGEGMQSIMSDRSEVAEGERSVSFVFVDVSGL
jgi:hypothetical protein